MKRRAIGITARTSCIAVYLFAMSLFLATLPTAPTSALSLPAVAKVNLPIGGTVLDRIVTPITSHTNRLTPVQINATPDTLGAKIALPPASQSQDTPPPLVDVNIKAPVVPAVVNTVVDPAAPNSVSSRAKNVVSAFLPTTSSSRNNSAPRLPTQNTAPIATRPTAPITYRLSSTEADEPSIKLPFSPLFVGTINFLGPNLPVNTKKPVTAISGSTVTLVPIIVSIGILLLMTALVIGVVYIIDHTDFALLRGGRLAHFAEAHDITQIAAAIIIISGAVLITIFLVTTYF